MGNQIELRVKQWVSWPIATPRSFGGAISSVGLDLCIFSYIQPIYHEHSDLIVFLLLYEQINTSLDSFLQKIISSADCGINKMCFSQPSDCDPAVSVDCYFMSAMMSSPTDKTIRYEMTGPSSGYISFGFSDDQMMVMSQQNA